MYVYMYGQMEERKKNVCMYICIYIIIVFRLKKTASDALCRRRLKMKTYLIRK